MSKTIDITQVAKSTPFDNSVNGFTSTEVQSAIEEIKSSASPGFGFGRSGVSNSGTYLQNETVPSNVTGRYVYINSPIIKRVFVSNENIGTFSLQVWEHDGNLVNAALLGTITITSALGGDSTVSWVTTKGKQLAILLSSGSAKNIVAGLELAGSTV
jgi:hypothetical protein